MFAEKIGQTVKAEKRAEQMLRQQLILRGIDPDAKAEISPELQARMDADAIRMKSDEELFFGGDLEAGKEIRGKKIKSDVNIEFD